MRIALTGSSGIVGSFILSAASRAGHQVDLLDRNNGYHLGDAPDLAGADALIHCAFAHAPGRYRGGEADDPETFRRLNLDGTRILFETAARQGVQRIIFLSSRAVHDGYPAGTSLPDDLPPRPINLYGQVKAAAEAYLADLPLASTSIRATGVYGHENANKWAGLFSSYLAGEPVTPRIATELHGDDLAQAMLILLKTKAMPRQVNASDLILDRHDLLSEVQALTGCAHPPPARANGNTLSVLTCDRLAALGWTPGGMARLRTSLPGLLASSLGKYPRG